MKVHGKSNDEASHFKTLNNEESAKLAGILSGGKVFTTNRHKKDVELDEVEPIPLADDDQYVKDYFEKYPEKAQSKCELKKPWKKLSALCCCCRS